MFKLHINTDNAALRKALEWCGSEVTDCLALAACLRNVADVVESGCEGGHVRDANGNVVGDFELTEETDQ